MRFRINSDGRDWQVCVLNDAVKNEMLQTQKIGIKWQEALLDFNEMLP